MLLVVPAFAHPPAALADDGRRDALPRWNISGIRPAFHRLGFSPMRAGAHAIIIATAAHVQPRSGGSENVFCLGNRKEQTEVRLLRSRLRGEAVPFCGTSREFAPV